MIAYVRWAAHANARLDPTDPNSVTNREAWEERVASGKPGGGLAAARKALEPPPYPAAFRYLHEWALDVYGRCGGGMGGLNPVSHAEISEYARGYGLTILPHERAAIIQLDAVMRHPEST